MASTTQRAVLTVEDYLLMPEGGPRYQLVDGDLLQMPAPNRFHQRIVGNVHAMLWNFLRAHPLGEVYVSPIDVFLDDINVFQPDVLFVSKEREKRLSKREIEGGPDLVVEVLSERTRHLDLGPKRRVFANHGVREYWLIDPAPRVVVVYRQNLAREEPTETLAENQTLRSPLLPGFAAPVAEILK